MDDELYDNLKELSDAISNDFSVIEEPIDMEFQMNYFKRSKKIKSDIADKELNIEELGNLYDPNLSDEQLMDRMIMLAGIDNPKAYRILEDYANRKSERLHQWSLLALQESKMLIEGNLLDKHRIFVSTGLGGRGNLLRYYFVLVGKNISEFEPYQQRTIISEFTSTLNENDSEIENVEFFEKFAVFTALMPLNTSFSKVFSSAIEQCNEFGDFLQSDFLITNVKILSHDEIRNIVENKDFYSEDSDDIDMGDDDDPEPF